VRATVRVGKARTGRPVPVRAYARPLLKGVTTSECPAQNSIPADSFTALSRHIMADVTSPVSAGSAGSWESVLTTVTTRQDKRACTLTDHSQDDFRRACTLTDHSHDDFRRGG